MPRYLVLARDSFPSGVVIEAPDLPTAVAQWIDDAIDWVEQVELHVELESESLKEATHDRTACDPAG